MNHMSSKKSPSPTTTPPPTVATTEDKQQHQQQQQQQQTRRSNSLHCKASTISNHEKKPQDIQRRTSEHKKQAYRIQNYVIYRKTIGQGSMGKVKLAECLTDRDQQKYAVKIMPKVDLVAAAASTEKPKDPKDTPKEREQRTVRELAIMYLLRHPNICQLKEYITDGDYYYMFLEYVDGGQLLDYIIRHGKLREKQARKFARQIASALDYCHRNSIVHRDLKIENILLTRDENIKIIDFGLSNIYSPSKLLSTFCGSLYFAAPELLKARHYTGPEVDVWSFGVVLYVLVCGRVPFDDTSLPALHAKIKSGKVDEYPDHLSKECVDLLSKILVVDPKKRLTLSAVENHPWMKRGYDEPISSNIPHRQIINTIDSDIIKGMHGFGLGDEVTIRNKLERVIRTDEYKEAALKIEQNQQLQWQRQNKVQKPRWRRSLTPIGKKLNQIDDDPLSLPAMYDPLLSIYYLVKERKEYDTRRQLDMMNKPLYNGGGLSRSTSTVAPRSKPTATIHGSSSTLLVRRKTDGSRSSPRVNTNNNSTNGNGEKPTSHSGVVVDPDLLPKSSSSTNNNNGHQRKTSISNRLGRSSSVRLIARSVTERTNSIREKSRSAVKILGSMLPNRPFMFADNSKQQPSPELSPELPAPTSSRSTPPKKSGQNWLQTDPHSDSSSNNNNNNNNISNNNNNNNNNNNQKLSASTIPPTKQYQHSRRSWRQLSLVKQGNSRTFTESNITASTSSNEYINSSPPPNNTRYSESDKDHPTVANVSSQNHGPKSKFHFNRGALFRSESARQLMIDIKQVLMKLNVIVDGEIEPYIYGCQCLYPEWTKFLKQSQIDLTSSRIDSRWDIALDDQQQPLLFTVHVYQERWANGKYGIKVKEKELDTSASTGLFPHRIFKVVQQSIETELESWIRNRQS
ncbi:unnamed protein product [Cunninghamella echinulata]